MRCPLALGLTTMLATLTLMPGAGVAQAPNTEPAPADEAAPPEPEDGASGETAEAPEPPSSDAEIEGLEAPDETDEADEAGEADDPAAAEHAQATRSGPRIELAPETPSDAGAEGPTAERETDLLRGMQEERFERAREGTMLGGYGELHYGLSVPEGDGESEAELDLHRLVIFLAHRFDERFRFYVELEVEHALAGGDFPGEVGVEQAFVDWQILGEDLGLRAGVVLVPMGIVNQWHEPPVFHGVERPRVDKVIIPSTWREGGVGVFGEPAEGLRYEAYLVGGLNPLRFRTSDGLRKGRQAIAESRADGLALTGRLELEPMLGLVTGLSGYASLAGPNAGELQRQVGTDMMGAPIFQSVDADVPVLGVSADARLRTHGLEARAVAAYWSIGDTGLLADTVDQDGMSLGVDAPSAMLGFYAELGFDLLSLVDSEQALVPFARFEYYDTTFGHRDEAAQNSLAGTDLVFGLSYRPVPQVVFKTDLILRNPDEGSGATLFDLGVGWMF